MFLTNNIAHLLKDVEELDQLNSYLINKEDSEGVVPLGHSTGCQVRAVALVVLKDLIIPLL